jgi:hypothetical protein
VNENGKLFAASSETQMILRDFREESRNEQTSLSLQPVDLHTACACRQLTGKLRFHASAGYVVD